MGSKPNPYYSGPKNGDPEFRHNRASNAAKLAHSVDAYINALVRKAPEFTPEQRERLAALLRGSA